MLCDLADSSLTSENAEPAQANSVLAAVTAEIDALGTHSRPGSTAAATALASVLDNPRATSSKSGAARVLISIVERLRAEPEGHRAASRWLLLLAKPEGTESRCAMVPKIASRGYRVHPIRLRRRRTLVLLAVRRGLRPR
jgi:hypothetical protein